MELRVVPDLSVSSEAPSPFSLFGCSHSALHPEMSLWLFVSTETPSKDVSPRMQSTTYIQLYLAWPKQLLKKCHREYSQLLTEL